MADEIRVIACGTGMPSARRSQAATCFLVELGDGQKFLFDIGSGSHANLTALMIPADFLTKVFLTHLHTDHWGDLVSLWAGGWTAGRTVPLEVWGPSGARDDMGTKHAVENLLDAYNWDYMTRAVTISPIPGSINVHEFDYRGLNQVVYEEEGVTIRSFPTIHTGDGPVSYSLEWNGFKIIIGGDTAPNKWYIEYASDADLTIHEASAIKAMEKMYAWDIAGRLGQTDIRGFATEITEFDYKKVQVVYEHNGVKITAFPAIHAIDGSVSYRLDWNDLSFVFSSDTYPNKWFAELAQDADLVVHECFIAVPDLMAGYGLTPEAALQVGTQIHTAPQAFGKVMSTVKPRMAVAYHFWTGIESSMGVLEGVRETYDGPLSLAEDYMVWNVTKDKIRVRMAAIDHESWNPPAAYPPKPVSAADRVGYSPEIWAGRMNVDDVIKPIYNRAEKALGREFPYPEE